MPKGLLLVFLFFISFDTLGQSFLSRNISLTAKREPLSHVLTTMGERAGFNFSYSTDILPADSLVTVSVHNKSVRYILDVLLQGRYQYKEIAGHVIIQRSVRERAQFLSGVVTDSETGQRIDYASIYSKISLLSALSNDDGTFRLRMKEPNFPLVLTVSKVGYADQELTVQAGQAHDIRISLVQKVVELDPVVIRYGGPDHNWLAKFFVSAKLRVQSRNIGKFFVSLPFQASLMPGLGTHGRMAPQVTNKASLNLLGGYTGGVNGVEVAGLFNLSKKDVKFVQIAGLFNVVAGDVTGFQAAGLYNQVMDSLMGAQVSGLWSTTVRGVEGAQVSGVLSRAGGPVNGGQVGGAVSIAHDKFVGFQASGAHSRAEGDFVGFQLAGAYSSVFGDMLGAQISGGFSRTEQNVKGLQIGIVNFSGNLKGVQIGLINIARASTGHSFGLLNFVKSGKKEIAFYANELALMNAAWKSGSNKLYSILMGGTNGSSVQRLHSFGFGLGKEFSFGKSMGLGAEILNQNLLLGSTKEMQTTGRIQMLLKAKLGKHVALSAGPAFSVLFDRRNNPLWQYDALPIDGLYNFKAGDYEAWLGWQAGFQISL